MADEIDPTVTSTPSWQTIGGLILTAGWLLVVAFYCWAQWPEIRALKPDAAATFLGGIFAPLAFLWLVVGYFQQGAELKHSVEALRLQSVELRNSVEQQRELVGATRESIDYEKQERAAELGRRKRAAAPTLRLSDGGTMSSSLGVERTFVLRNLGRACSDVRIEVSPYGAAQDVGYFASGAESLFKLDHLRGEPVREQFITITYLDDLGNREGEVYHLAVVEQPGWGEIYGEPELYLDSL